MKFNINDYKETHTIYDEYEVLAVDNRYVDAHGELVTGIILDVTGLFYEFVVDGQWHREDGPARIEITSSGDVEYGWCWRDIMYPFDEYVEKAGWTDEEIIEWKLRY